jgi:hypothetical protein
MSTAGPTARPPVLVFPYLAIECYHKHHNQVMEDLTEGDILIRISDESEWEFKEYGKGKITNGPSSGIIKATVWVRPLKPRKNLLSDLDFRPRPSSEFRKAKTD